LFSILQRGGQEGREMYRREQMMGEKGGGKQKGREGQIWTERKKRAGKKE
jgi:hypothetical protein